ncbi:glycosyltransferase family 4 protein [Paenibacillus glycanilyticus]|uniref:glycosyltransferase family 4 protein n=1 Tax=Paenibacillus glycanilyticus TaxID=126569 RepID=UPI00203BAEAC|nr:glycosyltransferase family 4 protein [Paenibacillus glycanilyticus]MCM3628489.1 glycosyltransferase family 4 protein [Paenibacillus glycanilyticus]
MGDRKSFYLLAPCLTDELLTKDVGIIPYIMQKHYGYKAVYVTYKPSDGLVAWPSLSLYEEEVDFDYLEPAFHYHPDQAVETIFGANVHDCSNDLVQYIEDHAAEIDVLFLFGFYPFYYAAVDRFKKLRPSSKAYLKLDANIHWINRTPVSDYFAHFLQQCDLISSESMVEYIRQKWSVPISYIPNGYYSFGKEIESSVTFEQKDDLILTVGRLGNPAKATDQLLEAFKQAIPYIPASWKLVLAGKVEESFRPQLNDLLQAHPELEGRIIQTGFVRDKQQLQALYRRAKIFALPSFYEASAHVVSEAKTFGCYLLVSDIESSREAATRHERRFDLLDDEYKKEHRDLDYGSVHAASDPIELTQRLIEACLNQERLKQVCHSTQEDAREHFDWVKLCGEINLLLANNAKGYVSG